MPDNDDDQYHDECYFGEVIASTYDDDEQDMFAPDTIGPVIDVLAGLAGEGPVLEFGIGTGRVASPLAGRGLSVHGIDISNAMMKRVADKPGAERISLTTGDFSTTKVEGEFELVYLVFNTIMNLTSQKAQIACFQNAADHLKSGGHFVMEVMIPRLQWLIPGERNVVWDASDKHWGMDEYDVAIQKLVSHHLYVRDGKAEKTATPYRYVWPAELDLMAQLAGMSLESRWQDWQQTPFDNDSREHISIWRKG